MSVNTADMSKGVNTLWDAQPLDDFFTALWDGDVEVSYLLHLGVYGYRAAFLKRFASLPPTPAEQAEKLEQLRALEHGFAIAVAVVDYDGAGIDTPQDYAAFVARIAGK